MSSKTNSEEIVHLHQPSRYYECHAHLAKNRTVFVSEDITKDLSSSLSAMLLYYDNQNDSDDINIYINTNGGDALALSNVSDVMKMIKSPIKTICIGKAYSAGAFILAAGTKGKRYMTKNSSVMCHALQALFPIEQEDQLNSRIYLEFLKQLNDMILGSFAANVGKTLTQVKQDCAKDLYLDARQAKNYGLIDHII
jgi:ATP-dependent Clp protease protease subunit